MANNFQTQDARPPLQKYSLPDGSYPTPNINDVVIVEDINLLADQIPALVYGTPHPKVTTAKLVFQKEGESSVAGKVHVRRIYVTERAAQDAYNYRISFSGGSPDHPIFTRTYLERRDSYDDSPTMSVALTKVYKLKLTAGGSGYTSAPTVVATGGAGTGFAATAQMQGNAVVALLITNCGTGYTSAPTISFTGGGGTGAAATAYIQPTTCLLVDERAEPAPGELGTLFLQVLRVYETLPGPERIQLGYDPECLAHLQTIRQRVSAATGTKPVIGDVIGEYTIVDGNLIQTDLDTVAERVTELFETPDSGNGFHTHDAYQSVGFQFPAIVDVITLTGWSIPPTPYTTSGPYLGLNYTMLGPRTNSKPGELVTTYHVGIVAAEDTYEVHSPGAASRFLPIRDNSIHDSFSVEEVVSGEPNLEIESFDASNPATYSPGVTTCVARSQVTRYRGTIYKKTVLTVVETPPA